MSTTITTKRLYLRTPTKPDAPRITELLCEKQIVMMLGRVPWPYQLSDAEWWIKNAAETKDAGSEYPFVIIHQDHGLIGSIGVMKVDAPEKLNIWEIGYWLGKPYWGNGYITEAATALLNWAESTLGATGFVSGHITDNLASASVLKKLDFVPVGTITHYARGRDCDVSALRYTRDAPPEVAMHYGK